ncbi:MAG: ABC transporter ATP-binding protein [Alphaproteobacteria bacterium]
MTDGSVTVKRHTSTAELSQRIYRYYLRGQLKSIVIAIVCMIITAAAIAAMAKLVEPALNNLLVKPDKNLLWLLPLGFIVTAMVKGSANYVQTILMQKVGLRMIVMMQDQMFDRIMSADLTYIQSDSTGRQMTRFTNDVQFLRDATVKAFTGIGRELMTVLFLGGVMIQLNWEMALIALVFMPISIFPIVYIGRRLRRISRNTQESIGTVASYLDDVFKAAREVKAYGTEEYERSRGHEFFESVFNHFLKAGKTRARMSPILETMSGFALAAVLAWGGHQVLAEATDVGEFMAFFTAAMLAYQPVRSLANLNASLQLGLAAADRIFHLLDYEPKIIDAPDAKQLQLQDGGVSFDRVNFSYDAEKLALKDTTITFAAGKTTALVGPSGAGKSTILNLIPRFYDAQGGRVLIDGQDISKLTIESLRKSIALVSQEVTMFNDTVRANIAYAREGASDTDVIDAAKAAAAHEFIMELPLGYDTMVGERGLRLSGGQRQRISIARAMLKNAPILLLDEATSSLDSESEHQVHTALTRLMQGRTTIVIAHRLSTVSDADCIYVLERGRVVESGTHTELYSHDGLYAHYCRMQLDDGQSLKVPSEVAMARGGSID